MQPRHFFHLIITYPFAVNFQRKRRCNASSLGVENFPISNFLLLIALNKENYRTSKNRLASMCRSREEEVLEGKGRETLFRNRLSRTKGMTPALCFECAPRTSVATLPRFIGFQWASLVASIEGCTFDAAFPRTEEERDRVRQDGKFEFDRCANL